MAVQCDLENLPLTRCSFPSVPLTPLAVVSLVLAVVFSGGQTLKQLLVTHLRWVTRPTLSRPSV